MQITGNEDHSISKEDAATLTAAYQGKYPDKEIAWLFGSASIRAILDEEIAVGIRIYGGLAKDGKENMVLVGVDEEGEDLENGPLAEISTPCPPDCATNSVFRL